MSTATTLAAAFERDPGFVWVVPESTPNRLTKLAAIFDGAARHCARVGGVETVDGDAGVGIWSTRSTMEIGFLDAVRSGMFTMPIRIVLGTMGRLSTAERQGDELVRRSVGGEFAYLMALGVDPERKGQGLGRRTVELVEEAARAAGHDTLALRTENVANVPMYRHLGFEVTAAATVEGSGLEVTALAKSL
ncbi:MAG: GNAT family N-acetyltransferase [Actinomycetota bacterium]